MGTATQECRAATPGSSLRKSKENCFKNEHLEHVCAFQKLRKHCISYLLKIVVKIPMTYCLKNFLHLSLSEVLILCPTLHIKQLPEGSFILSHQSTRTTVFFPSRMEGLFFMQGISPSIYCTSHTQTIKKWFRTSIEERNQKVLKKRH